MLENIFKRSLFHIPIQSRFFESDPFVVDALWHRKSVNSCVKLYNIHTYYLFLFYLKISNYETHFIMSSIHAISSNATQNKHILYIHWKCIYPAVSKLWHCLWIMWKKNMILWNIMSCAYFWLLILCFLHGKSNLPGFF